MTIVNYSNLYLIIIFINSFILSSVTIINNKTNKKQKNNKLIKVIEI
jgi:hypothetical protein